MWYLRKHFISVQNILKENATNQHVILKEITMFQFLIELKTASCFWFPYFREKKNRLYYSLSFGMVWYFLKLGSSLVLHWLNNGHDTHFSMILSTKLALKCLICFATVWDFVGAINRNSMRSLRAPTNNKVVVKSTSLSQ